MITGSLSRAARIVCMETDASCLDGFLMQVWKGERLQKLFSTVKTGKENIQVII
jgi:hypothetical protein